MKLFARILLVLLPIIAWGQRTDLNLQRIYYGQEMPALSARSLGMGGAGLAGDDIFLAADVNPALLAHHNGQFSLQGGMHLYNLEEDRSFPYYDNFGGFVDYGSYYFQNNWYSSFYGNVAYTLPFDSVLNATVSVGAQPFLDYDYTYFEEVRSTSFEDNLLAYNIIESRGQLLQIPLTVAARPVKQLAVGLSVAMIQGSLEQEERVEVKAQSLDDLQASYMVEAELDNAPLLINVGGQYFVNERLTVAAAYRAPYTLTWKNAYRFRQLPDKALGDVELDYPGRIGAGVDYRFENILMARLLVDYYYEFWSDFKDSGNPALVFEDTYNIRVGVEHVFFNDVPFRVGFDYGTLPQDRSLTRTRITVGGGLDLEAVTLDVAGGFSSTEHFQGDLYDDALYGLDTRTDSDRVRWAEFFGRVSLSYTFK